MRRKIEEAYSTSAQFEYAEQGFDRNWGPAAITNLMIALGAERRLDMPVDRTGLERGSAEDFYPIRVADEKVYMAVAMLGERELMYINADIFGRCPSACGLISAPASAPSGSGTRIPCRRFISRRKMRSRRLAAGVFSILCCTIIRSTKITTWLPTGLSRGTGASICAWPTAGIICRCGFRLMSLTGL